MSWQQVSRKGLLINLLKLSLSLVAINTMTLIIFLALILALGYLVKYIHVSIYGYSSHEGSWSITKSNFYIPGILHWLVAFGSYMLIGLVIFIFCYLYDCIRKPSEEELESDSYYEKRNMYGCFGIAASSEGWAIFGLLMVYWSSWIWLKKAVSWLFKTKK